MLFTGWSIFEETVPLGSISSHTDLPAGESHCKGNLKYYISAAYVLSRRNSSNVRLQGSQTESKLLCE